MYQFVKRAVIYFRLSSIARHIPEEECNAGKILNGKEIHEN
jgi:hypothetical protein